MYVGVLWVIAIFILMIALVLNSTDAAPVLYIITLATFLFAFIVTAAISIAGERVLVKDCQLYTASETTQNSDRVFYVADEETDTIEDVEWSDITSVHRNSETEHVEIYEKRLLCFKSETEYIVYLK